MSGCKRGECKCDDPDRPEVRLKGELMTEEELESPSGYRSLSEGFTMFMEDDHKVQFINEVNKAIDDLEHIVETAFQHILWLTDSFENYNETGSIYADVIDPAETTVKELKLLLGTLVNHLGMPIVLLEGDK